MSKKNIFLAIAAVGLSYGIYKILSKESDFVESKAGVEHLLAKYQMGEIIGKGGFGMVMEATCGDDKIAIKIVKKSGLDQSAIDQLHSELKILQEVDHPNIVKYYENYEDEFHIYICMEILEHGDLDGI